MYICSAWLFTIFCLNFNTFLQHFRALHINIVKASTFNCLDKFNSFNIVEDM